MSTPSSVEGTPSNGPLPEMSDRPSPEIIDTVRGSVEYAAFGAGPAVLCLHGAMGGYDQGLILARVLGEPGYRYIAISRPGYLRTEMALGRSPEDQADLCAALLDALGIQQAAVMAVSGGGPAAIHFALRHRQRCWALVLASAPAQKVDNQPPFAFKVMKLLARIPWFASSIQRKAAEEPEAMARRSITAPALLARTLRDAGAWGLLRELQSSTADRMTLRFAGTDNDAEVAATRVYPLEEIAVPTLVVQGTADPFVPFEQNGRIFAARVRGAELVALEGGEHAAIFSHRTEARGRVTRFLREHAAGLRGDPAAIGCDGQLVEPSALQCRRGILPR